jgi:hypothetical protein
MSHVGRCFRDWRHTRARKLRQGKTWDRPIRQKVPQMLRPFLIDAVGSNQKHAGMAAMKRAIYLYSQNQMMIGKNTARGR